MRHTLALVLALAASACSWPVGATQWQRVHATTLRLEVEGGTCSGTAVGRWTIATAQHCFEGGRPSQVRANGQICDVRAMQADGLDHVLLTTTCEFKAWAKRGHQPLKGDRIFVQGNPGPFSDLLRFGVVAGESDADGLPHHCILLDVTGYYGDSGAGVFNERGELVGIISIGVSGMRMMGMYPLGFGNSEWPKG